MAENPEKMREAQIAHERLRDSLRVMEKNVSHLEKATQSLREAIEKLRTKLVRGVSQEERVRIESAIARHEQAIEMNRVNKEEQEEGIRAWKKKLEESGSAILNLFEPDTSKQN